MKINMISGIFSHDVSSTVNQTCKYFSWDFFTKKNPISFYIDGDIIHGINDKNDGKLKFLWTLESPYFNGNVFTTIKNNLETVLDTYELIFTYNDELLKLSPKFKWVPAMGTWIKNPKIEHKTKMISMITSNKRMTPQQNFRVEFAKSNLHNIDVFGREFNDIKEKEFGLNDYMFSVCIENDTYDTYFTEKILDCFATGTIPIYKGTNKISNYFDSNGIIFIDDFSLESLSKELYLSKITYIEKNFNEVKNFLLPENFIYKNYLINY